MVQKINHVKEEYRRFINSTKYPKNTKSLKKIQRPTDLGIMPNLIQKVLRFKEDE